MKILIVASYNKTRFAPFIVEQAEALRSAGCLIDYFGITGKGIRGYLQTLPALKAKIKAFQPDIIHAHYGCRYCYANSTPQKAIENFKLHNPNSPILLGEIQKTDIIQQGNQKSFLDKNQEPYQNLKLF